MEERNPALPKCVGAFLAEEWSIDPLSTLPSFLEMIMIADVSRNTRKTLRSIIETVGNSLRNRSEIFEAPEVSDSVLLRTRAWLRAQQQLLTRLAYRLIRSYSPEIRLLLFYFLERRVLLSEACGTSADSIYGAMRSKVNYAKGVPSLQPLSTVDRTRLALFLSLGPYILEKLTQKYKQSLPSEGTVAALAWRCWPVFRTILDLGQLVIRWRFLIGHSHYIDASSLFLRNIVRRKTLEDGTARAGAGEEAVETTSPGTVPAMESTLAKFLSASVVLSWLTSLRSEALRVGRAEQLQKTGMSSYPVLQAPPTPHRKAALRFADDECPICRQPRSRPAASSSGFVFCYECILSYIRKHKKCPITGVFSDERSIIPLFEPFFVEPT